MPITHASVHQLSAGQAPRGKSLGTGPASAALLDKLKGGFFSRLNREHGSFDAEGEPSVLAALLQQVLADGDTFGPQVDGLAGRLAEGIDANADFTGYLVSFIEQAEGHHAAYLFLVQQKSRFSIDPELGVGQCVGIDFGQSLSGIKVDILEWQRDQHYAYLSCLAPRSLPGLGEAFLQLTGFRSGVDKREETLAFLDAVEEFGRELPADSIHDYRNQVVDYCLERERADQPLEVQDLAQSLADIDRQAFIEAVRQEEPVWLDRRSLQRYVRFSGREKDLSLSFTSRQLDGRIRYDADSDTLSIRGLPAALREQLLAHKRQ